MRSSSPWSFTKFALPTEMKTVSLALALALALSLFTENAVAAVLYDPQAAAGRMEKKHASPPIRDVIADVMARIDDLKPSETRMESRFSWPFGLPFLSKKDPQPDLTPGSFLRTKSATTTTTNDY